MPKKAPSTTTTQAAAAPTVAHSILDEAIDNDAINAICAGEHGDAFAVLGLRDTAAGQILSVFLPNALSVSVSDAAGAVIAPLVQRDARGFFSGHFPSQRIPADYRLTVQWPGSALTIDDPYRFPAILGAQDIWLLAEGSHLHPFEHLGAHPTQMLGVAGVRFAVWAPNAQRVSVIGNFNAWDGRRHAMRRRLECGVWEIFLPGLAVGEVYKYEIRTPWGELLQKADPYALAAELPPATASVVANTPPALPQSRERALANAHNAPISIYEVHLGSWRRVPEEGNRWLSYREHAQQLVDYAVEMGFTHIELLPIHEHPYGGSWGYQPTGLYAPTARYGSPEDFLALVAAAHAKGVGLILDWVPGHFPTDAHAMGRFDGTPLYEHADPREGFHRDWNTLIYNYGRREVCNFLTGNALYWLERYAVDGLRVDAVASMLYRDYSRPSGEWVPNQYGGRENLEAIHFLRSMNETVSEQRSAAITLAEESTSFPSVSRAVNTGGLGFAYKWNMGWMHDTLQYMARDAIHRQHHHHELTFGLVYAFSENFVLPLSHDEVVHGKGSLLNKMSGDRWQQFATLRAYYGFMWGHPGKKLLFMGCEFAQDHEWRNDDSLDWHLLEHEMHRGVHHLVRDLNRLYRATPALYQRDFDGSGFEWICHTDNANSVFSFIRHGENGAMALVISHFTPVVREGYRLGVPGAGTWQVALNTDSAFYGGGNVGVAYVTAEEVPMHGRSHSIVLTVPPLATLILVPG